MADRKQVIVCGVDGSTAAQKALEWAMDEAVRRSCKLRVITAWAWDGLEAMGVPGSPEAAHSQAKAVQDRAVSQVLAGASDPPEVEKVLVRGTASENLCLSALDAELMVLGSHGHGAVHDTLVGSTSKRAIHHASCPVVIVPDPRQADRAITHTKGRRRRVTPPHVHPVS